MTLFRLLVPTLALAPVIAGAQTWPDKPIRLVVPFSAAGPTDVAARLIEPKLRELLKQPVIIDNRVGATGAIGSEFVAKAAPGGYTLLLGNIKAGKIRALDIASAKRNPELPDVPTITEAGVPGYITTI